MMASSVARNLLTRQLQRRLPLAAASQATHGVSAATNILGNPIAANNFSRRYFSVDGNDDGPDASKSSDKDMMDISTSSLANTDYDIEDIMSSFSDTSYYDPMERPDYSDMSNADLRDTSTIPGWELIHSPPKDESIPRGALVGTVVSTKMTRTVNVAVDRYRIHRKYRKRLRYTKKFMAHDESQVANTGDLVMIVPCQRISKQKHFMLREIIRAKGQL